MSADKELLELAAKAAGAKLYVPDVDSWIEYDAATGERGAWWWPLGDGADTLALEIDLRFTAAWEPMRGGWSIGGIINGEFKWLAFHEDRKRATTMAAAEIGRVRP